MKFLKFINEDVDIIKKECAQFIDELASNKYNTPLFRGSNRYVKRFMKVETRSDRVPKDTSIDLHNAIDKIYQKATGHKLRSSSVFCHTSKDNSEDYGVAYYVFPVGNYSLYQHPHIFDIFQAIQDVTMPMNSKEFYNMFLETWKNLDASLVDKVKKIVPNDIIDIVVKDSMKSPIRVAVFLGEKFRFDNLIVNKYDKLENDQWSLIINDIIYELHNVLENFLKKIKKVNLKEAHKVGNEVHLVCDSYYLVEGATFLML